MPPSLLKAPCSLRCALQAAGAPRSTHPQWRHLWHNACACARVGDGLQGSEQQFKLERVANSLPADLAKEWPYLSGCSALRVPSEALDKVCVCVHKCVRACMHARMRVCVCTHVCAQRACACACVHARVRARTRVHCQRAAHVALPCCMRVLAWLYPCYQVVAHHPYPETGSRGAMARALRMLASIHILWLNAGGATLPGACSTHPVSAEGNL